MGQSSHGDWLHGPVRQGRYRGHPFCKPGWALLTGVLKAVAAVQLANVLSTEGLFYACILPFIAFFGSFAFVMYPLRDIIHPTGMHQPNRQPDCV